MPSQEEVKLQRLAQAERIIALAQKTRSAQRAWWATRYKVALEEAQDLEAQLDWLLIRWYAQEP